MRVSITCVEAGRHKLEICLCCVGSPWWLMPWSYVFIPDHFRSYKPLMKPLSDVMILVMRLHPIFLGVCRGSYCKMSPLKLTRTETFPSWLLFEDWDFQKWLRVLQGVSGVQCNGSAYFCYCLIVRLINTTGWTEALCNNSRGLEMALHCFLC